MRTWARVFAKTTGVAVLLALAFAFPTSLQARVVGMVIDDSGSMVRSFQKALFAAQILIGSLSPDDRLFIVRLNDDEGRIDEIPANKRSDYIAQMQKDWGMGQSTPYQPLAKMLEHLASATGPGEQADLLVFADGAFSGVPENPRRDFEALKSRFSGGRLQVFFVWLPGDPPEVDLRAPLLSVFNGSPTQGATDIDDRTQVFPGLRDVIAQISGADPLEAGKLVRFDGNRVQFQVPFGVRRVVVLTAGDREEPPSAWRSASFPLAQDPPLAFAPRMLKADRGDPERLEANLVQLVPRDPLLPDTAQELVFDRPLKPDDRLLFDSDLKIALEVLDARGQPVVRDPQGRARVPVGEGIHVGARFLDRVAGRWQRLQLADTGLAPEFTLNDGAVSRPMDVDRSTGEGQTDLGPYASPGPHSLTVMGRIKGLKYLRADDLLIDVVAVTDVHPGLTLRRLLPCDDCAEDRIELPLAPGPGGADGAALEATLQGAGSPTDFSLVPDRPLPPGITLIGPGGTSVVGADGSSRLTIHPSRPTALMLRYDDSFNSTHGIPLRFTLSPLTKEVRGSATLALELVPVAAPLSLIEDGHTGPDQDQPFSVSVTQLGTGQGVYVVPRGLRAPLEDRHLRMESEAHTPMGFILEQGRILVTPQPRWWGTCFNRTGDYPFHISYRHPDTQQSAVLHGVVPVSQVSLWERCRCEALIFLALLLLAIKLFCLTRRETFPRRSRILRLDIDATSWAGAGKMPLHFGLTAFFLCRAERRRVYGFELLARSNRAAIRRSQQLPPGLYHAGLGETLDQAFSERRIDELPWGWNEELIDEESGCRYVLVEDIARQREPDQD